ncbi:hypothetical protein CAP36_12910 [Chitinophagaceae bacterium IBVUCB2]|nr:hypothetical protein CAP36_12910 [Chitinophagaceae bacterium IBVUCB2]
MKYYILLVALSTILLSSSECSTKKTERLKGKLEIAGICMNYTIKLIEGKVDSSLVAAKWTDETTGKIHENVFRLGSPCTFPVNIKQGDEFYFTIDTTKQESCMVCEAYYPTPAKAIAIKVEN